MIASGLVMRHRKWLNVAFHLHGADMRDVTETIAARLAELNRRSAAYQRRSAA